MSTRVTLVRAVFLCALLGTAGCGDGGGGDPDASRVDAGGADAAPEPACTDGTQNGDETDVDCGGGCAPCDDGATCGSDDDCVSERCASGTCAPALLETGTTCTEDDECVSGSCMAFGDTSICTEPCTTTCPGEMLACFDGTCTPRDYCENADGFGDGPGCTGTVCDACDATATCVEMSGGGFECMCNTGYSGDGRTCADDDECTLGTAGCDANATCTNTPGSFTCECNAGYEGDGTTCADADECALGTDTCPDGAICTNTVGSFTCACGPGYDGDGTTCTDIDECALGTDTCDANATCTNTPGAYDCTCNAGFIGDGMTCVVGVESFVGWVGDTRVDGSVDVVVVGLPGASFTTPTTVNPITTFGNAPTSASFTQFSPDGRKIAFRGDFVTDGVQELFVVDLSGASPGPAQVVNGPLVSGGNVGDFRWSPDSTRIVYSADQNTDAVLEIFVVNVSGAVPGPSLVVNGPMVSGGDVQIADFNWSPDGTRIAYQADQLVDNDLELFVTLVAGPTPDVPQRVNTTLPVGADVEDRWAWAPDGSYIVYQADQDTLDVLEVYLVDLTGAVPGAPVKLNGPMVTGGDVGTVDTDIAVSFDGAFVAYVADQNTDGVEEVFAVDVSGATPSAPILVSGAAASFTDNINLTWSPTARRLVYASDQEATSVYEVYLVDLSGAAPTAALKIHPTFPSFGRVAAGAAAVQWSPDGRFVGYRADTTIDNGFEVDVVDLSGAVPSAPIDASPPRTVGNDGNADAFEFAPDSSAVAVRGEGLVTGVDEAFVATLTGTPGTPVSITGLPTAAGGQVTDLLWTRDPRYVIVEADYDVDGVVSAYLIDVTAPVIPPVALNAGTPTGGDVSTLLR